LTSACDEVLRLLAILVGVHGWAEGSKSPDQNKIERPTSAVLTAREIPPSA
jgi:hypothetical protein